MGVPTSEVSCTSATTRRRDQEGYKGHVMALGGGEKIKEGARNGFILLKFKALHPKYFQIVFSMRIIIVVTVYSYNLLYR
jgi:hypothetical protein